MGLSPSSVSLNPACPSQPILRLLGCPGLWGRWRKVLVDRGQCGGILYFAQMSQSMNLSLTGSTILIRQNTHLLPTQFELGCTTARVFACAYVYVCVCVTTQAVSYTCSYIYFELRDSSRSGKIIIWSVLPTKLPPSANHAAFKLRPSAQQMQQLASLFDEMTLAGQACCTD